MALLSLKNRAKELFPQSEISWAAIKFERESDPFIYKFIIYFLSAVLIAGGAFSTIAKIPITVIGDGKITSLKPPVPIRSSAKMTVAVLNVAENQHIKKGHVILQSKENLSVEDVALLKQILQEFSAVLTNNLVLCKSCTNQLRLTSTHYLRLKAEGELINVVNPLTEAAKELILSLEENSQIPFRTQDSNLQISLNRRKMNEIRAKKAEQMLAKEFETLSTEIASHQARINEKIEHARERISSAKIQMNARIAELRNRTSYLGQQYTVYAPFDGIVVSLNVKGAGELLQTGQELMSLVPENSPLIFELKIENKDISDIVKNAPATIAIDALPEFDYGYATGHVVAIIRKQIDSDKVNQSERTLASVDVPVFMAQISLDQQALSKNGVPAAFMIGMTAKGQINLRSESIMHTAIRTLLQTRYEIQGSGK